MSSREEGEEQDVDSQLRERAESGGGGDGRQIRRGREDEKLREE